MTTDTSPVLRIALIVGSVRSPRMADPLTAWLRAELAGLAWLELDVIDLATVRLPLEQLGPGGGPDSPIADRLAEADGFLVLTPEYNHSFPAALKNAIDWHFAEWARKPVAFVGYGAGSGGIRAVEQLRAVFPEVRATTIREAVLLPMPWERLGAGGGFEPAAGTRDALLAMMDELRWWAESLRAGRARDAMGVG
ncbi:NADPH-dependent FMN reductase [Nocardioides humi]|uniref:NAD(P)H-dependent oxidoreductase n=1 Tax=Nocardioides humi TaxID=449461 RepID=A0ABN2AQQ3_9ACTN|nr:NAD(P)H-dependent oxidoreductase [Nocardioides humi]